MFSLFKQNTSQNKCVGFEDIKKIISCPKKEYLLINTMDADSQDVTIKSTLECDKEETTVNNVLNDYRVPDMPIVVYGKNCADMSVEKKREQLIGFGLKDVFIYYGGLFEWLLLNELYGDEEFPLQGNKCGNHVDILKYRPPNKL
jgi:hypothetical protein